MDANEIIQILGLKPLQIEGGYFVESYRADETVNALPARYQGQSRAFSTAIYYLLTPDNFSAMHRVKSDEVFHFYLGGPVEMLQLFPDGTGKVVHIGTDLAAGFRPQVVAPRGVWQGCRLIEGGKYALLGATVAPGFDYSDFELGTREELVALYRKYKDLIAQLTD